MEVSCMDILVSVFEVAHPFSTQLLLSEGEELAVPTAAELAENDGPARMFDIAKAFSNPVEGADLSLKPQPIEEDLLRGCGAENIFQAITITASQAAARKNSEVVEYGA
jgi:hypothetical protein